jgi:2,3,4,5-tetrahydropyridine-2,6-dicarboxylate N-succinyltransferase
MPASLPDQITELWDRRDELSPADADAFKVVRQAIDLLDRGEARVADVTGDGVGDHEVTVNEWAKLAILLLFRLSSMETTELGPFEYADKIPLKQGYQASG